MKKKMRKNAQFGFIFWATSKSIIISSACRNRSLFFGAACEQRLLRRAGKGRQGTGHDWCSMDAGRPHRTGFAPGKKRTSLPGWSENITHLNILIHFQATLSEGLRCFQIQAYAIIALTFCAVF
jgi:hypothetical protein